MRWLVDDLTKNLHESESLLTVYQGHVLEHERNLRLISSRVFLELREQLVENGQLFGLEQVREESFDYLVGYIIFFF